MTATTTAGGSTSATTSTKITGKTYDGVNFQVPETHDMVRSLFDPTIRKSYAEILICLCLFSNYLIYRMLTSTHQKVVVFLSLYLFWRFAYNFGIGYILYYQSNNKFLVKFAKEHKLFNPKLNNTLLQRLVNMEIRSKMGKEYNPQSVPIEFNTWLIFRQFVDLILMQDFVTYMFLVFTCGKNSMLSQSEFLNFSRIALGLLLIGFNLWVKIDAHRVVKDYAWYWGDFFFLEENELIFDGVYDLSPHPMYSIGYLGYYGFALITKSYLVLIVSLFAHFLQFIFLTYVENPHIEKIYGTDTIETTIEELEMKESYLKPLIFIKNFNPVRITDYLSILISVCTILSAFVIQPGNSKWTVFFFIFTLLIKLTQSILTSYILHLQSVDKFWTKLNLKYGLDNIAAYSNWQALYNFLLSLSYSSIISLSIREILDGQYKHGNWLLLRFILGMLLILLQMWTSYSIFESIGEFGWFYGDFFLPNMSKKSVTTSGIYRYLNDPERLLGVSGIWGLCLITYSPYIFILAMIWVLHITIFLNFVEKPHMVKIYGQKILEKVSGVSMTIQKLIPGNVVNVNLNSIYNKVDGYIKSRSNSNTNTNIPAKEIKEQILNDDLLLLNDQVMSEGYSLEIVNIQTHQNDPRIEIGDEIEIKFEAPADHSDKDWIGLYKVLNTGSSRDKTTVSSQGHWVGLSKEVYPDNFGLIGKEEKNSEKGISTGVVKFSKQFLYFEKGIYELRYHNGNTHIVKSISKPFEIFIPKFEYIDGDGKEAEEISKFLFKLFNKIVDLKSIDGVIDYKKNDEAVLKLISSIILESTGIEIATQVIKKLKTIDQITNRILKSKAILDELNNDSS